MLILWSERSRGESESAMAVSGLQHGVPWNAHHVRGHGGASLENAWTWTAPVIYVCNHLSNLDPPIVASVLPRRALFLAKREIFSNPLFSFLLRGWGAFPVSRYSADLRALRWVKSMVGDGRAVVMFPEGTRSRNMEGMKKGQIGTALVAAQTGATVVPIAIEGTDRLQNILKVFAPIAKIKMSVGEPFRVAEGGNSRAELERATMEMMSRLAIPLT